jgi:uncharacterized protein (TIGR02145 family)
LDGGEFECGSLPQWDPIPEVKDGNQWSNLTTGAWCYYDNDIANGKVYGKLYNWYAVNDARGLCSNGYHVPSDEEWAVLENYLGGREVAGGKMKSTTGWTFPNTGATNESGFNALPNGIRVLNGSYNLIGSYGNWWSSTESGSDNAWAHGLVYNFSSADYFYSDKQGGFSVRCVRD